MNPSFNIKSNTDTAGAHLFVFVSEYSISMAVLNREHVFTTVCVYNFEHTITTADKNRQLESILNEDSIALSFYGRTDIIWCTHESIITPQSFFTRDGSAGMLNLVYGDAGAYIIKHELILKQHAYNIYRIKTETENSISSKFPNVMQWHQASLMVNFAADKKDLLYCNFNPGSITVMLRNKQQLQLVQTFEYNTPEDAAYYLLNVCQRFEVTAAGMIITASGMIDESSNLYKELYKYFSGIEFFELPDMFNYSEEIKNYPAHYFSHLFTTAACVL